MAERLLGLRLRDLKNRVPHTTTERPPLRSEVILLCHPVLPRGAAQPWLTERGCLTVAFLLLIGSCDEKHRYTSRTEVLLDAKHLVSLALPPSQDEGDQNDR
ncbi:unnamed protein product, partial [Sphacelaria rigidula]